MLRMAPAAVVLVCVIGAAPAAADTPLVYVRCARTTATLDLTGEVTVGGATVTRTRRMTGLDVYDVMPDVSHFFSGFSAPCDLVYRDAGGAERVLHDCSTTATDAAACAAMDPAVSFDGKTIAFTVFRGSLFHPRENVHPLVLDPAATNTNLLATTYPNRLLDTTEAQLHLVDVATGMVTPLPHTPGTYDTGPAFSPDGRLLFTSTRDDRRRTMVPGTNSTIRSAQLWAMDVDGRNPELVSPHGLGQEEHPFVLRDGRVAYTSWQGFGAIPFRYGNGSVGGFTTLDNLFQLFTQHPDGANPFALFGMHAGDHTPITSVGVDHKASHFLTQTRDGRVWTTDYYRANNNGLGHVLGLMPPPDGQEGMLSEAAPLGDLYAPTDLVKLAAWSTSSDGMAGRMPMPPLTPAGYADPMPYAGKVGHPAVLPGDQLMVAWGKGPCSTVSGNEVFDWLGRPRPPWTSGSGQGTAMNVITSLGLDTPGCDLGLYRVEAVPVAHPSQLTRLVDSRDWHELMGRAVVPYQELMGVAAPAVLPRADRAVSRPELPPGSPFGLLGAASITDRETRPIHGIHFAGEHQWSLQGTDTIDYTDDELCGVRILAVQPNRGDRIHEDLFDLTGERVLILGEVPVRRPGAPMDPSGNLDTSFLLRMPADTPYVMQGIDCDGRTLNSDQTWQSLRPGEEKTCGGCHVHSRPSRISFAQSAAAAEGFEVARLGEGEVPLLAGRDGDGVAVRTVAGDGLQIGFERDIVPIFERRCVSCHGGATPAANLALDRPGLTGASGGNPPSTWWCLVVDRGQSCVPAAQRFDTGAGGGTTFRRPQVTRYLRALNARGSLLYWKAAGQRTDGRRDDTFTTASPRDDQDLDFGPAHPTTITAEELGLLGRWIDLGAPGGAAELEDTSRPTLTLAAIVAGDAVTELRVGTVDVPSGIEPTSLTVCVVAADGTCGPDLAGDADPHGVVAISLPTALTDPDVEVEARVSDKAGNQSVLRRTVRRLLDTPPPAPETPDAGGCCQTGGSGGGPWLVALVLGALLRRRRTPAP